MSFQMKYAITPLYIDKGTKRRSGRAISKVRFVVAHDTGNYNSTARNNVDYFRRTCNQESASAHLFVDDREILECVPALTASPEKAWHVLYNMPQDNIMFGDDANDCAIGVEYCFGSKIYADEAYKKYVWVLAYICFKFNLNPAKDIAGHMILDPKNRTDPQNGLSYSGRSYTQLLSDVVTEYASCIGKEAFKVQLEKWQQELGQAALKELAQKGAIENPEYWAPKLAEGIPGWAFWEMYKRMYEKIEKK